MRDLWTVMRLELMLYRRGKAIWIVGLIMAFFGVWAASGIREMPDAAWTNFGITTALFISLILTFATGDQVSRDRERRLDGVLLSTPISTAAYVWGKYLAGLVMLLGLAGIGLIAAILADQFYNWQNPPGVLGHALFPPLGPQSYIVIWCWLVVVPTIFGAALVLAEITITRGQRIVAYMCVLIIWITSLIFNNMPDLLDMTTYSIYQRYSPNGPDPAFMLETNAWPGHPPDAHIAQQVIHLVQANIPPSFLPISFLWNRLFFLALAVLLILLTVHSVGRQRQGAM
jgi:ABC-type transport system involved in multi-copper enzyme maturation permease subunit